MSRKIYLDYAAATPMSPEVLQAMLPYYSDRFYNPSANYLASRAVKNDLAAARSSVAVQLGAKPAEVIFTAGATEANNLAIRGVASQFSDSEVLASSIEHESVRAPAGLFANKEILVDEKGALILNKLSKLVSDKTVLVSVALVNNEIGTIQTLGEIAGLLNEIKAERRAKNNPRPLYLHTDAAQAGNYLDLHTSRLGVDLMSVNGGKLYGPKQSGALYVKAGTKLMPQIIGGGQEFGMRSGTENVAAAIGFAEALKAAQTKRKNEQERITGLRELFESKLLEKIPGISINGQAAHRAPHISSITFAARDNERLMMELDEQGIECATGSACSASSEEPSHTLLAIGLLPEQARSTLRFSFGAGTDQKDINATVEALTGLIAHNR